MTPYLEQVRRIVLDRLKKYPAKIYLFGSWATGKNWRASDIDVAVLPLEPIPPRLFSDLREALEESHVPYPVEIVDLSRTDPAFRRRVEKEGVLWSA